MVLVIEDQPILRLMAVDLVEEAGFEALEARGADDAVRLLETRDDIRLVFTDIDLADGADGLRLAHVIRDRWPPVGIIVTSGRRRPQSRELPVSGVFFGKPYDRSRVADAMRRMVS
ncbi:response regulator [Lichenibacterium dinghuense]|uniref:response regulator n=1 Tax=Lichenibacterium dinghuense TaxID=2895977 RepID=UPI002815E846|nr:response regulator [Lichenibacterium sp. 6Y81]